MTNHTIHIMLDLETWGKRAGFDIRSIGACVFDPLTGMVSERLDGHTTPKGESTFYIATDNPEWIGADISDYPDHADETGTIRRYPLRRDPETVAWWSDQSEAAQGAFADPVDLREACEGFSAWLDSVRPYEEVGGAREYAPLCIWSHGSHFDIPILEAVYHAVGLPVPWHYRSPRDTRTAFDMAGIDDHSKFMQQFNYGTDHHALHDAISQARAVCAAHAVVRGWRRVADDSYVHGSL